MQLPQTQKLPFIAFAGADDLPALQQFAQAHNIAPECVQPGDIRTATEFLSKNPSPQLLLVEIPSAQEAAGLIDALADVCEADTKVVIIGHVNEYSFYCWLTEIGIFSYLLKPMSVAALEGMYQKSLTPAAPVAAAEKPLAKVIAVTGARGGVGATTIALNLAGIIADAGVNVALLDTDMQSGSIALALDVEPSRGVREALERPERIDDLFVERVMHKISPHLSVLCPEESLQESLNIHEKSAAALMQEVRSKFDVVVIDVSRHADAFARKCLACATQVVLVSDLTLPCLRDALRVGDLLHDTLGLPFPLVVTNRIGLAKQELKPDDFEKGINAKLTARIPFAPDVFMSVGAQTPVVAQKQHAASKALYAFASELVPEVKPIAEPEKSLLGFLGKTKKA